MTAQANILSFDEARKTVGTKRSSSAAQKSSTRKSVKRTAAKPATSSTSTRSGKKAGATQKKNSTRLSTNSPTSRRPSAKKSTSTRDASKTKRAEAKTTRSSARVGQQKNTSSQRKDVQAERQKQGQKRTVEADSTPKISKFSEAQRNAKKAKAGRAFTKQFGDTSSAASSGGSRAAVYKGEMGRQHKKATKMQNGKETGFFSRFSFSGFPGSSFLMGSATLVITIALAGAFLYPAAKQYYMTVREHDQMVAEYEAIQERNDKIQTQVDSLSTPEGIEDHARSEYGWVKEGENAVLVRGLETGEEESNFTEGIPAGSVEAPETWYSAIGDTIFGL